MERVAELKPVVKKYDWAAVADGETWKATKGTDFDCSVIGFSSSAYAYASRNGFKCNLRMDHENETVTFRFTKKESK